MVSYLTNPLLGTKTFIDVNYFKFRKQSYLTNPLLGTKT